MVAFSDARQKNISAIRVIATLLTICCARDPGRESPAQLK